jgi:hypothetical protein
MGLRSIDKCVWIAVATTGPQYSPLVVDKLLIVLQQVAIGAAAPQ